jgi:ribosomal protein S15P/S13E
MYHGADILMLRQPRQEEKSLRGELNGILRKIDRMKDDGHLSPKERDIINRDIDRLNKHITREKRDDDTRRRR